MAINLTINGVDVSAAPGCSILDAAAAAGIEIPSLCHDVSVKPFGACGICVVEAENMPRLLRACSTAVAEGMVVHTDTPRVLSSRKSAIELLMSDHTGDCKSPCTLACPANTDCQGYIKHIAAGEYEQAVMVMKENLPLPASIGRVCPHPCEEACRRHLVEEPVSIANLKSFAADIDLNSHSAYIPELSPDTGKTVGVIGGGAGGLSIAYFLRRAGHAVTVYDSMPQMGGMLRYGIPEYRLPKTVLDAEIAVIERMGVRMINNRAGELDALRAEHDAVVVAIGAWRSMAIGCPGEERDNVQGGIDFLRAAALGTAEIGRRVAVVGGGNTAMDACRTALRLGAEQVYLVYRRTREQMPAEEIEISQAEEEGVSFKYLTNPVEILDDSIVLEIMELGEPDASGRRRPVPTGATQTLGVDTVILAIGQEPDTAGLSGLELNRRGTIMANERTFATNLAGVFAIGDATNKGASIAIEAIGEAKRAAVAVDSYLMEKTDIYSLGYLSEREAVPEDYADVAQHDREQMPRLDAAERRTDFRAVDLGYTEQQARSEASRCLECGCADYFECRLVEYATRYAAEPGKYAGAAHRRELDASKAGLVRNPEKCILCGLCVRVCEEVKGITALGFVGRGFDTQVLPALGCELAQTECDACGKCVEACPTGAMI